MVGGQGKFGGQGKSGGTGKGHSGQSGREGRVLEGQSVTIRCACLSGRPVGFLNLSIQSGQSGYQTGGSGEGKGGQVGGAGV